MTSRLTSVAILFAVITSTSLAFAATAQQPLRGDAQPAMKTVQLERVVITGKRLASPL